MTLNNIKKYLKYKHKKLWKMYGKKRYRRKFKNINRELESISKLKFYKWLV